MTTSVERRALNEGTFRAANERLERGAIELIGVADGDHVPFLCECSQMECTQVVLLTVKEYEQIRSTPTGGFAALGHEDLEIETIVTQNERFVVTDKFGRAGEVHAQNDQRTTGKNE